MSFINELKRKLEPTNALLFYNCGDKYLVEHRTIKDGRMGAGQPLDMEQLVDIKKQIDRYVGDYKEKKVAHVHGVIPANLLYADTNDSMRLVWWRKPESRRMFFKDLGIPEGVMQVPGMVYSVKAGSLYVYCFRGRKPKGLLYKAPYFNVYNDGRVCLGNSRSEKPKNGTFDQWLQYWEKLFWQSEFASLIGDNPIEGNLATVTKRCIQQGTPFPVELMKRANVKLSDLLKE